MPKESIIETLVKQYGREEDADAAMKQLKHLGKHSDDDVTAIFEEVWKGIQARNSKTRLKMLELCHVFVMRSKTFRAQLLGDRFPSFAKLVLRTELGPPLPPPQDCAQALAQKSKETMQAWFDKFGSLYSQLSAASMFFLPPGHAAAATKPASPGSHAQAQLLAHMETLSSRESVVSGADLAVQCAEVLLQALGLDAAVLASQAQPPGSQDAADVAMQLHSGGPDAVAPVASTTTSLAPGQAHQSTPALQTEAEKAASATSDGHGGDELEQWEFEDAFASGAGASRQDAEDDVDGVLGGTGALALAGYDVAEDTSDRRKPGRPARANRKGRALRSLLVAVGEAQRCLQCTHKPALDSICQALDALPALASKTGCLTEGGPCGVAHDTQLSVRAAIESSPAARDTVEEARQRVHEMCVAMSDADLQRDVAAAQEHEAKKAAKRQQAEELKERQKQRAGTSRTNMPRDPTAANPNDPYTITCIPSHGRRGGQPLPSTAKAAMRQGGTECTPQATTSCQKDNTQSAAKKVREDAQAAHAECAVSRDTKAKSTIKPGALASILQKAPVLEAGDFLRLWDSKEEQLEFVSSYKTAGEVYNHWGPVNEDSHMDPQQLEDMLAKRRVFSHPTAGSKRACSGQGPLPEGKARKCPARHEDEQRACASSVSNKQPAVVARETDALARVNDMKLSEGDRRAAEREYHRVLMAEAGMSELGGGASKKPEQKPRGRKRLHVTANRKKLNKIMKKGSLR